MLGRMQARPLALPHVFHRAERLFPASRIITGGPGGADRVIRLGDWAQRARRLATALDGLGLAADARVGTLATNNQAHLEAYFAVPLTGRVLHTINLRSPQAHLVHIIGHAATEAVFIDRGLLEVLWPLVDRLPTIRWWVVLEDGSGQPVPADPRVLDYEALLAASPPWPGEFVIADENRACGLCYTSGTSGDPKGVLYSHRSTLLHTLGLLGADSLGIREADTVLPIVPMFHVNAWGLPYAAILAGADLVLPGAATAPAELLRLVQAHRVTVAAAATTVWSRVAPLATEFDLSSLRLAVSGGSATPPALAEAFRAGSGIPITHSWGMTEISPLGVFGGTRPSDVGRPEEELIAIRARQGRPVPLVDLRLVDEEGHEQPWDGSSVGQVEVAGPWVAAAYHDHDAVDSFSADGWLRTGDLGTITPDGYLKIVDRVKDMIKSGGEWISSIDLENAIMSHPGVAEAAVVGRPDPRWDERPVACVVARPGVTLTAADILDHLRPLVAKWWLPDEVVFLAEIPKTGSGKFSKVTLRRLVLGDDGPRPDRP